MKAVIQTRYGSPYDLVVQEVETPVAGDGEVLVRVRAASLHPDVWHVVCGRPAALRLMGSGVRRPKNRIPGTDMAGIVESTGKSVTGFAEGDAVFGETMDRMQWQNGGAFAEYVVVRPEWVAHKPDNVTFEQAASVPSSGYIALLNLRGGRVIQRDMRVLVNGAGGGVGSIALQVAKALGAHVTAVDSSSKHDMLRSLGADDVIDFTKKDFTRGDARYDFIFDVPGNYSISKCMSALAPDGKYVLIGHESFGAAGKPVLGLLPLFFSYVLRSLYFRQLRLGSGSPTRPESIATLRDLLEAGKLTPVIDSTYPLEEIHEAFRHMIEDELRGKVMITMNEARR